MLSSYIMFISEDTVKEIKNNVKILDIVSDYVALRKNGKDYFGRCPFHDEKSASFSVSPGSNLYYCFGCNVGGDVIKFIQEFNSCNFTDAIIELAQKSGIEIKLLDPEKQSEYEQKKSENAKLLEIISSAAYFYQYQLKQNVGNIKNFLDGKGINNDRVIDNFLIGYASNHKDSLYQYLLEKIPEHKDLFLKTGLFKESQTGLIDFFRDRVVIPIRDVQGKIIAFGGRSLDGQQPKYLNSPETVLFNKSQVLFGLNVAKDRVRKFKNHDSLILVEGYFDVIALHEIGFTNAVACLGTALTEYQIKQLLKVSNNLYLCLDSDKAGIEATRKIIQSLEFEIKNNLIDLKIINLPEKDASDFVLKYSDKSQEEFKRLLNNAKNWVDWLVDSRIKNIDLSESKNWKSLFNQLVEIIGKLDDIDQIKYIQQFSELLSVNNDYEKSDVYNLFLKRLSIKNNIVDISQHKAEKVKEYELTRSSEAMVLRVYLHNIKFRKFIVDELTKRDIEFCLSSNRYLWIKINEIENIKDYNPGELLEKLIDIFVDNNEYETYFNLSEDDTKNINFKSQDVVNLALNHLELKSLEIRLRVAHDMWRNSQDIKYFDIYKAYFEQFKAINSKSKS